MLNFNRSMASIHAYMCADGYVITNPKSQKHKYYYIGLRNTCNTLLLDFQKKFYSEFNVKPRICKDGRAVVQNKELYHRLTNNFSYYSREWRMPSGLSDECLKSWLRSYFDCEGWVFVKAAKNRHIGADSVNFEGLHSVSKSLSKLGIKNRIKPLKNRDMCRLFVYGKEELIRFRDKVGFLHPDKKDKLNQAISSYKSVIWSFPTDISALKKFICDKIKIAFSRSRKRVSSVNKSNLVNLSKYALSLYGLNSVIYGPLINSYGTEYYELNFINNK